MSAEFRRSLFSWPMLVSILLMAFCFLYGNSGLIFDMNYVRHPETNVFVYFADSRYGSFMSRFAPLLCVLPVAANFADDYRSGMFPLMIQREGLNRYLWHKILSAWLTGTLSYTAAMLMAVAIQYGFAGPMHPGEWETMVQNYAVDSRYFEGMWKPVFGEGHYIRLMVLICFHDGLYGGICAMIALAASAIYPNRYVALASPFLVTLLDQVIRILIPMDWNWILYTGGLLFSVRADYIDLHDLLITPWVWSGICIALFVWRVRRRVRDGEFA